MKEYKVIDEQGHSALQLNSQLNAIAKEGYLLKFVSQGRLYFERDAIELKEKSEGPVLGHPNNWGYNEIVPVEKNE